VQAVDLNLATRPFKNDTLVWSGLVAALSVLAFVSWYNLQTWLENRALLADLRESQANLRQRFDGLEQRDSVAVRGIEQYDLPALDAKAEKANEVIRWKSFSWTRLFNQLEAVQPWDVQMSSIHPVFRTDGRGMRDEIEDPDQVPVSVEGTAKTLKDLLAFERELIFDPHFDRIEPESYANDELTGETVFRMRFLYDPRVTVEVEEPEPVAEIAAELQDAQVVETDEPGADGAGPAEAAAAAVEETGELASDKLQRIDRGGGSKSTPEDATDVPEAPVTAPAPRTPLVVDPAPNAARDDEDEERQ
jgi:hypothetical protein